MLDLTVEDLIVAASRWQTSGMLALGVVLLASLLAAPGAHAADRIYWSNFDGNSISYANLNGNGGGGTVDTTGATVAGPMGLTIDPSRDRLYWTNWDYNNGTTISYASLDGGGGGDLDVHGATVAGPHGLAIDPSIGPAGRLYWPNAADNTISYADLDGAGGATGGDLAITNATVDEPRGMTVDPGSGRLYWSNFSGGDGTTISYADLGPGGGDGDLLQVGSTGDGPEGTAIDPVSGRIFWSDYGAWTQLAFANVDGSGVQGFDPGAATVLGAHGVAIDPVARRLYWANYGANSISSASLAGGDGRDLDTSGASLNGPDLPALLEAPAGTADPQVSGGTEPGAVLSCSRGGWAGDVLESLLYRAPHTVEYQWLRDGTEMAGADGKQLTATEAGDYRCRVTARNAAGATSQSSTVHRVAEPASNLFTFGGLKRNRHKGTATLAAEVPGPGRLKVSGRQVKSATVSAAGAGKVRLPVDPRSRARKRLDRRGRLTVHLAVTFRPTGGAANTLRTSALLLERRNVR